jgi:hypothetical protein
MRHIGLTALLLLSVGGLAARWSDYRYPIGDGYSVAVLMEGPSCLQGNCAVCQFEAVAMGRVVPRGRCVERASHEATCPELRPSRR